jgi:hypothetical protein
LKHKTLNFPKSSEYQKHIDSIVGKVPGHADRFVALCYMISEKIDQIRGKVSSYCDLHETRMQLKAEIRQLQTRDKSQSPCKSSSGFQPCQTEIMRK